MHLDRLIVILEAVSVAGRPVSSAEVQQVTKLPRPTCYRLLQTLTDQRLLTQVPPDGRFLLGERFKRIALMGQTDSDVRLAAAPIMKDAALEMGDAFFLSRFRNDGVEIIHVETPDDPKISFIHPGLGFRPMHACSCSKAIAAFSDSAFQEKITTGKLKAYTALTKTSASQLQLEFEQIRERGYAECVEEIEVGMSSVAAPVRIGEIGAPFSIGAIGSVRSLTPAKRARIGGELQKMATQVGTALQVNYLDSDMQKAR